MTTTTRLITAIGLLALFAAPLCADAEEAVSLSDRLLDANERYRKGDIDQAINAYESLVEDGARNGYLFYNLGNAYFLQGRPGKAVLWYERARLHLPRFDDLNVNLNYVRNQLVDETAYESRRSGTLALFFWLYDTFTIRELLWAALAGLWLFCIAASAQLAMRRKAGLRWVRYPCWAGLAAVIIFGSCAMAKIIYYETVSEAVITAPAVEIKTAPGPEFSTAFSLHEGTKVRVMQRQDDWLRIRLAGDATLTGWTPRESLERIQL